MKLNSPLVSICCTAFNHEKFIRDAIEGLLMQQTNFNFEIIVHDDASTDGTAEIIREYEKKFPKLFVTIFQNENQYSKGIKPWKNFVFPKAKGKYIAICEGDDYWSDPLKLQKQVDFLDSNTEYSLCFHKVKILNSKGILTEDFVTKIPLNYEFQDTFARLGNYIHTPSIVFRNTITKFPKEFISSPLADFFLIMLITEHGKIHMVDEFMAVYRLGSGIWSSQSIFKSNLNTAYTFAILSNYYKDNHYLSNIFIDRIRQFVVNFRFEIKPEHLIYVNANPRITKIIYEVLLEFNLIQYLKYQIKFFVNSCIKFFQLK